MRSRWEVFALWRCGQAIMHARASAPCLPAFVVQDSRDVFGFWLRGRSAADLGYDGGEPAPRGTEMKIQQTLIVAAALAAGAIAVGCYIESRPAAQQPAQQPQPAAQPAQPTAPPAQPAVAQPQPQPAQPQPTQPTATSTGATTIPGMPPGFQPPPGWTPPAGWQPPAGMPWPIQDAGTPTQ